jgi:hypothetical protein
MVREPRGAILRQHFSDTANISQDRAILLRNKRFYRMIREVTRR